MSTQISDADLFRDALSTTELDGKRKWIYPRIVKGVFYKWRTYFSWLLLAVLFAGPWLEWNGHPIFLFNVLARKFIFFGVPFVPQDFHLVAIGLLTFIVFIILFTVNFGRVWCGWACPQTIFMEMIFRKIENAIEGDFSAQKRLDKQEWNFEKIWKKGLKHIVFFTISFIIANTFLAYLIGKQELLSLIEASPFENLSTFVALVIFTFAFYFVFAKLRELACIVVCPYGRLQSVLLDKNSMIVAYDHKRGEPRGRISKKEEAANLSRGDCIDCKICVQVCPTGIDIRNGNQLECIGCTACIDACDSVMEKISKPKGLIRYASEHTIETGAPYTFTKRSKAYSLVLALLLSVFVFLLVTRTDVETTVLRVPGLMYQTTEEGNYTNLYNLEVVNKTFKTVPLQLQTSTPGATLKVVNAEGLVAKEGESAKATFFVEMPASAIKGHQTPIEIVVLSEGKVVDKVKTNFLGPAL
jgi:cytochrome c oxidase accessory protein FixG